MPEFKYTARDQSGQMVTGTLTAANRREATASLAGRSIFPLTVNDAGAGVEFSRVRRVPGTLLSMAYGQMADLLRSGVPLLRAIEVVEKQASHAGLKAILGEIHRRVEDGSTLADAMARFENVLGEMAVSMVRAGGEGGFLEEALARVAQFTETQDDLKKRTMGAIAYPAFLAVVGTIIVVVLVVFFVPKFGELFQQLREKGELPAVTEWLLATSAFMRTLGAAGLGRAGRRRLVDAALAADRGGALVGRPLAAAAAAGGPGVPRPGGGPLLPRLRHALAQRRADRPFPGNLPRCRRQPRAGRGDQQRHREHFRGAVVGGAPGGQRPVPARGGGNDRRRRAGQQPGNGALVRGRLPGTHHLAAPRPDRAADRADHALDFGGHHPGIGDCPLAARAQDEYDRVD